ncbi:hypothetical protein ACHAWF_001253 [Thalassiosira exigua]
MSTPRTTMKVLHATLLIASLALESRSFSPAARRLLPRLGRGGARPDLSDALGPRTDSAFGCRASSPASPLTAKKRRRRKQVDAPNAPSPSDDLPDFDDDESEDDEGIEAGRGAVAAAPVRAESPSPAVASVAVKRGSGLSSQLAEEVGGNVDGLDQETIISAMRGKAGGDAWQPPRSVQETLGDRSLEKFMDFEKMIEQDGEKGAAVELPEFEEVVARRRRREAGDAAREGRVEDAAMLIDTAGMGKKATRNAQRRAEAIQREAEMEEDRNPFEGLNILKLLENGAWVGIGLLVVWEIYINSPFFDRSAPLIPVVYDEATPPGM